MVPINYWAVVVCAVLAMVWGFVWYGFLFSKAWIREMGWTPEEVAKGRSQNMTKQYATQAVGALVMAFVFAHALYFAQMILHEQGASLALQGAFWNWLGFVLPVSLAAVLWEGKSWKWLGISAGYYLVVLSTMGLVIAYWPV
jgi:hypothetical protein